MVAWDQAKAPPVGGGERREILRVKLGEGDNKLRLVGDVMPRYVYWVTTKEGRKMPVECLRFDRETQEFNDSIKDPVKEIPEEVFSDNKPQFAFVCNAIDLKDKVIKLFDLRATIFKEITTIAGDPDYGNPADAKNGYDINVFKEKTGPLPQNVKYRVIPARNNRELSEEELELELYELDKIFKRPTYEEQKKWLIENTTYFAGEAGDEFVPEDENDLD